MADNIFSRSLIDVANENARARSAAKMEQIANPATMAPQAPVASIEDLAIKTQVPANIIEAISESAGVKDLSQLGKMAETMAGHMAGGKGIEDALSMTFPGTDVNPILDRADAMARATMQGPNPAPDQPAAAPADADTGGKSWLTQALTALTGGAARATGSAVDEAGERMTQFASGQTKGPVITPTMTIGEDGSPKLTINPETDVQDRGEIEQAKILRETGDKLAGAFKGWADRVGEANISAEARKEMQNSGLDGSVLDHKNIKIKEGTTARGLALAGLDAMGSMVPIIIAGIASGGVGSVTVGAAMSGGGGRETAEQLIDEAASTVGEDGRTVLEVESPLYRREREAGKSHEEAVAVVKQKAGDLASAYAAPIGALGGYFTGKIVEKGVSAIAGRSMAERVVGNAVLSALEEGSQEAAESIAGRSGAKQASGLDIDVGEGTAQDFFLGAISGAPAGAAGGIRGEGPAEEPLGLPAPERLGLPAPDAPQDMPEVAQEPQPPVAVPIDQGPAPVAPVEAPAIAPEAAPAPDRPPLGALSKAAASMGPIPEAPARVLREGFPAGSQVDISVPDLSQPIRAEFVEETPHGITVKIDGATQLIPRDEVDAGQVSIKPADLVREAGTAQGAINIKPDGQGTEPLPIPAPDQDISTPVERTNAILDAISFAERENGITLSDQDRADVFNRLDQFGGDATTALFGNQEKGPLDAEPVNDVSPVTDYTSDRPALEKRVAAIKNSEPPLKAGFLRMYHGGDTGGQNTATSALPRAVSYSTGNPVRFVDIPKSDQRLDYVALNDFKTTAEFTLSQSEIDALGGWVEINESDLGSAEPATPNQGTMEAPTKVAPEATKVDEPAQEPAVEPQPVDKVAEQVDAPAGITLEDHPTSEKSMVLKGLSKEDEARFEGMKYRAKWNEKLGGFLVSKKQAPKIVEELNAQASAPVEEAPEVEAQQEQETAPATVGQTDTAQTPEPAQEPAQAAEPALQDTWWGSLPKIRHAAKQLGIKKEELGENWNDKGYMESAVNAALSTRQLDKLMSPAARTPKAKPVIIPEGGFDRLQEGYERVMVDGQRSTDQQRMTEDGYVVKRKINSTEVIAPTGQGIFNGKYDTPEGDVIRAIEEHRAENGGRTAVKQPSHSEAEAKPQPAPKKGLTASLSPEKQARLEELKAKAAAKMRTQMNSGLDPELLMISAEMVALYVEAGARRFGEIFEDFRESTGTSVREAQAAMRAAYGHVRDEMDLNGEDISGMDSADQVMDYIRAAVKAERDGQETQTVAENEPQANQQEKSTSDLAAFYASRLADGAGYRSITEARKEAADFFGRDLTEAELKTIEEAFESAVVETAKGIASDSTLNREQKFDRLADLYQRQPKLAQRTSTSIEMQAYSTPAPLAFIASRLAGVSPEKVVYEPTAGTGMLVMEGGNGDNLWLNELQADRVDLINRLYPNASVTNGDGAETVPDIQADVVIANPPFGRVKENGTTKTWPFTGSTGETNQIDHAISMKSLSVMNDDGSAVLIVGGINEATDEARKKGYQTPKNRAFWKKLYDAYNVVEHFTVDGKMYERQGAGWPVDVVVIKGRKKSEKPYPMKTPPAVYNSWEILKGRIDGTLDSLDSRDGRTGTGNPTTSADTTIDAGSVSNAAGDTVSQVNEGVQAVGAKPDGGSGAVNGIVGQPVSGDRGADTGNAGARVGNAANADSASPVPDGPIQDQAGSSDAAGDGSANLLGPTSAPVSTERVKPKPDNRIKRENNEAETSFQVQYSPRSNARFAVGTLVPKNVSDAVQAALSSLEERVGDIDAFVAGKLGYSVDELLGTDSQNGFFSAEQVDALALAIDNVDQGAGFIIGDQTGVGKGRIVAGMIRYAYKSGKTPVFFTVKPGLYGDMVRDLRDIGMGDVLDEIMITNDGMRGSKAIPLSDDPADTLKSEAPAKQSALMDALRKGKMPDGKKILFTTYDQMNRVREKETDRMKAIEAIAPRAMFILDESHEAGGSASGSREPNTPPRSAFMRKVLQASPHGKMFSSATFAKNSTVMSLYSSTNMRHALESADKLEGAIENGGVPMLQVVSSGLVNDGQYVRRERTYEGISMEMMVLKSDMKAAENGAKAVREIFMLDNEFMTDVRDSYAESLAEEGEDAAMDGAIGSGGASSTNFASTMHNVVGQLLLSIKAKEVADKAIALHKEGKKPIIALSNTNASIIQDYVSDRGLELGDEVNVPFNEILQRYLQRLRRITIKDADGNKSHHFLTNDEIVEHGGPEALMEVQRVEKMLNNIDLSDLPGSPIDYISDRLSQAGVKVEEITGRSKVIRSGILETRTGGQAENKRIMNRYNSGATDAIIINRSGATGFSMHARKAPDNDGKVRAMLILQPDANIDVFMQMLGRINRTGQSQLPEYYITVSDLAIEKRPAAVLMKKLASLNASTTANKKSAVSLENAPDFMNKHGDTVVNQYLRDNRELSVLTGITPKKKNEAVGIAAKFTGRLIVLGPERTEEIYRDLEEAYASYISELDAAGTNDLEAKVLEIDAKTMSSQIIAEGSNPESAFGRDTVLETIDAKVLGKPYSEKELRAKIEEALGGRTREEHHNEQKALLESTFKAQEAADDVRSAELNARLAASKTQKQRDNVKKLIENHTAKIAARLDAFNDISDVVLMHYAPGTPMLLTMGSGENTSTVYAMALGADLSRIDGKTLSPSKIQVKIALGSAARQITIPASRLMASQDSDYQRMNAREEAVFAAFEGGQAETRETRQIVTGNVVSGFEKFKGRGQITMFRRDNGDLETGIILPKELDAKEFLRAQPVTFRSVDQVMDFLMGEKGDTTGAIIRDDDFGVLKVSKAPYGSHFNVEIGRGRGSKSLILNKSARDLVGDFTSRSGAFKKTVRNADDMKRLLSIWADEVGIRYATDAFKDEANEVISSSKAKQSRQRKERPSKPRELNAELQALTARLNAETERLGLKGKITVKALKGIVAGPISLDGFYLDGVIGVSSTGAAPMMETFSHEIIHALRDPMVWGADYGLFTKAEWQGLVRQARRMTDLKAWVAEEYPDLSEPEQIEEVIAEMYARWKTGEDTGTETASLLRRISDALSAIVAALRGEGFNTAAEVFAKIEAGHIGRRSQDSGPDGTPPTGGGKLKGRRKGMTGPFPDALRRKAPDERGYLGNLMTKAMSEAVGVNVLALVPGHPLISELAKAMPSATTYLRLKEKMDTRRNQMHSDMDKIAQDWRKLFARNWKTLWLKDDKGKTTVNQAMMDLMHETTIAQIDPSKPFQRKAEPNDSKIINEKSPNSYAYKQAEKRLAEDVDRRIEYDAFKARFDALPADFQAMYRRVRDAYADQADAFEKAVLNNAEKAMKLSIRRAERTHKARLQEIADEGLTGAEKAVAIQEADEALAKVKRLSGWTKAARMQQLRASFESNRLGGPYFPLKRFGSFFVTARNEDGQVLSYSQFETETEQQAEVKALKAEGHDVTFGTLDDRVGMKEAVDPSFVADVEALLDGFDASDELKDLIWQRWLESLPDMSVRKNRIHRKGRAGYSTDAFRAFGHQMFHGAHQLARLEHAMDMAEALELAREEAQASDDPNRNGLIVNEMQRRHDFTMAPKGASWATKITGAAFIYYLAASPASALVNISQTTVVGPAILGAYRGAGIGAATKHLGKAMTDFTRGRGHAAQSKRLTADERAAMEAAYKRGVVDKSQAHDLAGVGESGVEYSALWQNVMSKISFFFHHAERMNREITFLAAYRLARDIGEGHEQAIETAGDLTKKTHFDYQSNSRPRLMQNDTAKVLLIFRNFQVNMLYRLFRDVHQSFAGADAETRKEARTQLAGITASMFLHAGIKGVWGYSLLMMLAGMFFGGDDDDLEAEMQKAVVGVLGKDAGAIFLNGVPGYVTGTNLTERMGMPDLWFRSSNRVLEGEDQFTYWMMNLLGPAAGILSSVYRGYDLASDGQYWRGAEAAAPKAARDILKTVRYTSNGAETLKGDPIIDQFDMKELFVQALGFTPARLSERYEQNNRAKNMQTIIADKKSRILKRAGDELMAGKPLSESTIEAIKAFNEKYHIPLGAKEIRASIKGRLRASANNNGGIVLPKSYEPYIRSQLPPSLYE